MKRRSFLEVGAKGAAILGLSKAFPEILAQAGNKNILFISIDDMSDWAGPFGTANQKVYTPGIDKLAAMGTTFTKAYCAAPACGPSRTALMTGVHPLGYFDEGWGPFNQYAKPEQAIPKIFLDAGYKVLGTGKLFHGQYDYEDPNIGFKDPSVDPNMWSDYKNLPADPLIKDGHMGSKIVWGPLYSNDEEAMPDRQILRWAQDRLLENHGKPLFLGVGFYRPHLPWFVPQRFFDMYPLEGIKIPDVPFHDLEDVPAPGRSMSLASKDHQIITGEGNWAKAIQAYLASMSFADDCLLQLLDSLEKGPNKDNTMIVLWTDHGWHLGEKLGWRKFKLWERATKVPLIFAGPGIAKGAKNDSVVSLMDVKPTLTEMALGQTTTSEYGISLRGHLSSPGQNKSRPVVTAWGPANDRHVSVRSDRWRYIQYADGSEELYDHDADPKEHINLLAQESSKALLAGTVSALRAVIGR